MVKVCRYVVYLGVGTNKGNRISNLLNLINRLKNYPGIKILKTSSIYETSPIGPYQKDYLNAVIKIKTRFNPFSLLNIIKTIEKEFGRIVTKKRWGPRIIDLDILFYSKAIIKTKRLVIPHPEISKRRFVLEPMSEISPNFVHPILKRKVISLAKELRLTATKQKVKMLKNVKWE